MATEENYPYVSQFCFNGGCEGTVPLNWKGDRLPLCPWDLKYVKCTHECHEITAGLAEMAAEMGKIYNPTVAATVAAPEVSAIAATLIEIRKPAFQATPSGRLASGQLEQWLYAVLKAQVLSATPDISDLAFEIQLAHPEYQPSAGAIQAVLERWAAASYIKLGAKPIRVLEIYQGLHDSRSGTRFSFGSRPRLG
jgi:hypothetical protein